MIVRFALFTLALLFGLAAPAAAQVDIGALRAAIEDGKFAVSDDQTLSAEPVIDLSATNSIALSLYARYPITLDRDRVWMLFTLRTGPNADDPAVPNALSNGDPVSFILTFAATENTYNLDARPTVRSSPNLSPHIYALNCLILRFPYDSPSSDVPLTWTFTPRDEEDKAGCSGNLGVDGGRWLTFTSGDTRTPLLAMGDKPELVGLLARYSNPSGSQDSGETVPDEQPQVVVGMPETIEETRSDNDQPAAGEANPTRVDAGSDGGAQGAISDVEGARYAGIETTGLTGRRIRQIALLAEDSTEVGVLHPLRQDEYRSGKPGYWENGTATGDYILRLPGAAAWSQAVVIPENGFVRCDAAAINPSVDAFGASVGKAQCNPGRLPVTVAVDTGFVLKEDSHLTAGSCSGDEDLIDAGAPSNQYCALVEETDFRLSADDFGIELEDSEARERIDVLPGTMRNLAEAAEADGENRRVINLTPQVRLKKQSVDISLVGDAIATEHVTNRIVVTSGNVGRVVDTLIESSDPPILKVDLEFEVAQSLQNALNTLSRNEVTVFARSVRDDLELLTGSVEQRESVPVNIDLRSGTPRPGYNVLRVALPSARLPARVTLEGRLVGYDATVRNYSCRVGLRIGNGSVHWLEHGAAEAPLPAEIAEAELGLDQVIDIVTGPIENLQQDNTLNCLPQGTRIAQVEARNFPDAITVPFARPVLVYWLRTGAVDEFYNSESLIAAGDIYSAWIETVVSTLSGQRIFSIRKPVSGGFETIQSPSRSSDPVSTSVGVTQLVANTESEIFGDVALRDVFEDADETARKLGLKDVSDVDIVILSNASRRLSPLGHDGGCGEFEKEARVRPYNARIVLLRDVRQDARPSSEAGPFARTTCSETNNAGQSYTVEVVETKAAAPMNNRLVDYAGAFGPALDVLLERVR